MSFLTCKTFWTRPRDSTETLKTVHVTSVLQTAFYEAMRILFACKENKNNNFIQRFLLFRFSVWTLSVPSTTLQIFFVHTWVYCDCVCVCVCVSVFMSPHMYLCQHRCVSFVPPFICVCTCVSYVLTWPRHPGTFQRLGFPAGLSRPFSLPMQSH